MLNKQFSIDTKLPADCVSLLPIHKQGDNNKFLFVCATYNLDDGLIQKKSGGIVMGTVTVNQSKTEDHLPQVCLKDVQHIPLSFGGILDLKWYAIVLKYPMINMNQIGMIQHLGCLGYLLQLHLAILYLFH